MMFNLFLLLSAVLLSMSGVIHLIVYRKYDGIAIMLLGISELIVAGMDYMMLMARMYMEVV